MLDGAWEASEALECAIITINMVTKPFRIVYAPHVGEHLKAADCIRIDRKYHFTIHKPIVELLQYEPEVKSTNRKPLKFASKYGEWELRFGEKNRFLTRSPRMRALLYKAWEDIEAGRGMEHDDFWKQDDPEMTEPLRR